MKKSIKIVIFALLFFSISLTIGADDNYEIYEKKVSDDVWKNWEVTFNEPLEAATVNNETVFILNSFKRKVPTEVRLSSDGKVIFIKPLQIFLPDQEYQIIVENIMSVNNERLSPSVKIPFVIEKVEEKPKVKVANEERIKDEPVDEQVEEDDPVEEEQPKEQVEELIQKPETAEPVKETEDSAKKVEEQTPKHINDVKVELNSLASIVTVKASDQVASVYINGSQMHYQGNNTFQLPIPDLKKSQSINIEAYSSFDRSSLLEQINHTVK